MTRIKDRKVFHTSYPTHKGSSENQTILEIPVCKRATANCTGVSAFMKIGSEARNGRVGCLTYGVMSAKQSAVWNAKLICLVETHGDFV